MTLPIDDYLPAITAAVAERGAAIVKAEPGAGKTTRVPAALLASLTSTGDCGGRGGRGGRILVLEPRRLAARLSAERVAAERGEPIGQSIGYQIRLDSKVGASTGLVFQTEGVFLRQALASPKLDGVACVVLDEFHERHMQADLALAIVEALRRGPRPDLKLVIMSATLDTAALAAYLPGAPVFDVPGRTYPVTIEHRPPASPDGPVERHVADAVETMLADARCPGNILVFLTGMQEIRRCAEALTARLASQRDRVEVLPLTADLPPAEQARVFAPERSSSDRRRRVVLATNVAETSLTLPGITGVVDAGRAKIAAYAPWSGMPTLDVRRVSRASCIQRSGRAGRTAPGVAYRLFSESDFLARAPFLTPEIKRLDFAGAYLEVLALCRHLGKAGAGGVAALPWLEAPDPKAVESSRQLLLSLGALDSARARAGEDALTRLGEEMAAVPLHPRLAAVVVRGMKQGIGAAALLAACLLAEGIGFGGGRDARAPAMHDGCDVHHHVLMTLRLAAGRPLSALGGQLDVATARQALSVWESLAARLGVGKLPPADAAPSVRDLAACLLAGFPDRVAGRRTAPTGAAAAAAATATVRDRDLEGGRLYNFCMGRGGILSESSCARGAPLILALDAEESQARSADRGALIRVATALDADLLADGPAPLLEEKVEVVWVPEAERVDVFRRTTYAQLVLEQTRLPVEESHGAAVETELARRLAERWPKPFPDAAPLDEYHARVAVLSARYPELAASLPVFTGEMLELLQAAIAEGKRSFKDVLSQPLLAYVLDQLPYDVRQRLEEEAPHELALANGRRLKVHYEQGKPPYLEGFVQDFYGVKTTPTIGGARGGIPVTLQLWGPNRRPLQVTGDLAGFWQRTYRELKGELSRDYPRHHWPETPESAPPVLHKARLPKA